MTDTSTLFQMEKQTVADFLDISGVYNIVLIDVLCSVMLKKELPLGIVQFTWNYRIATSFNMMMRLWCTRHTTNLFVP
jgi:hypothetical protein